MGQTIYVGSSFVHIKRASLPAVVAAFKEAFASDAPERAEINENWNEDILDGESSDAELFERIVNAFGFDVGWGNPVYAEPFNQEDDVVDLIWNSNRDNGQLMDQVLDVLKPFVEAGSYLSYIDNDSNTVGYVFDRGTVRSLGWDTLVYRLLKYEQLHRMVKAACGPSGWTFTPGEASPHGTIHDYLTMLAKELPDPDAIATFQPLVE